jgi:hypothetical protein
MEDIAREVGKNPSTVAYWVNKHGLSSPHSQRHRARGRVDEGVLAELVEQGLSVRQIGQALKLSASSVRHWLNKYGLKTQPARYTLRGIPKRPTIFRECSRHGWVEYRLEPGRQVYRCGACASERVAEHRRRVKSVLVAEAGGACLLCGYDKSLAALQFHHLDPEQKEFHLSHRGMTRSLESARQEARKCVLLCANCHAEVEVGIATLPAAADSDPG